MSEHKPTWYEIDRGSDILAGEIVKFYGHDLPIDYVVGITQGGLLPATIISGLIDKPMMAAGITPLPNIDDNLTTLPNIKGQLTSGMGLLAPHPKLLIVNHESSVEMNQIVKHYKDIGHEIITAVLYYKDVGKHLQPNFFWRILLDANTKIYYPWASYND